VIVAVVTVNTVSPAQDQSRATYRDVFAVPEFRVLFASFGVFMVGETVKMLTLSVLVYERTGSAALSAFAYVAGFLPHALGGVFLLALADRWRPRTVMVGYELLRLAVVVVLALGVLTPAAMLALVCTVGLLAPVSSAVRTALLPELLSGDAYVLGRSVFTVTAGGTQVLGYAAGGLLLGTLGPHGALWLTAAACALSALLIRVGVADRPPRTAATSGAIRQTWQVNGALLRDRRVRGLLLAQWLPGSLVVGAEGVVVPYVAELGPGAGAGVLYMAGAMGMLAGDLLVGRFVTPMWRERLTPWLALLLGVPMLAFILRPGLAVAATLFAVAMFGSAYHLGLARRFLDALAVEHRGQAFGLVSTGMLTFQGLAVAGAGALAEVISPSSAMVLAGGMSIGATLLLWRQMAPGAKNAYDTDISR
jgi:MFS family permease